MVALQISGGLWKDAFTKGCRAVLHAGNMNAFVAVHLPSEAEGSLWAEEPEPGLSSSECLCFMT